MFKRAVIGVKNSQLNVNFLYSTILVLKIIIRGKKTYFNENRQIQIILTGNRVGTVCSVITLLLGMAMSI